MWKIKITEKVNYSAIVVVEKIPDKITAEKILSYIIAQLFEKDFNSDRPKFDYNIIEQITSKSNKNINPETEDIA